MFTRASQVLKKNSYTFLIIGGMADAITTWYAITMMGAYEFNPVMSIAFFHLGIIPGLILKLIITIEGGRVIMEYAPRALHYIALGFMGAALWNCIGIILMLALTTV